MTWLLAYVAGLFLAAFRRSLRVVAPQPSPDQRELVQLFLWPLFTAVALGTWTAERIIDAIYGSYRLSPFEKQLARGFELTEEEVALARGRRKDRLPRVRYFLPWLLKKAKRIAAAFATRLRIIRSFIRRKAARTAGARQRGATGA